MPKDLRFREFNALKIWHHADRLKALANRIDIAPVTIEVDPVAYCNHHCFWCVDPSHKQVTASLDFLWNLLEELAEFQMNGFQVRGIVFKGGGEPTLHPDFCALVEKTKSLGFEIGVVTNGSRLVTPGLAEVLAQCASYVRVSIDGPTPETHYRVHGSRDFEAVVSGAQKIIEFRKKRHPIVGLSFALDYQMMAEIPNAIVLGEKTGADYVLIRPPFFEEVGRASTMTPARAAELRQNLMNAAASYTGPVDVLVGNWIGDAERQSDPKMVIDASGRRDHQIKSSIPIEHRLGSCWASPLLAVVAADGQVYGCCNLRFLDKWSFGKIDYVNGKTFSEVWSSAHREHLLGKMQATECIVHCTHPMARYNEIIEELRDKDRPHADFV
jgi:MoaA/NifB/PqqE/SkfB family radical SAM enzyme